MKRWTVLCVGLPGTLVIVGLAAWLVASWFGMPPTAAGTSITLSEAAMLADHADVLRLIRQGADPNAPASVREGMIDFGRRTMLPLEAATRSHQPGIMQLLINSGARIAASNYPSLWCSAQGVPNNADVMAFLIAHQPPGLVPIECSPR
jgi:hypothetical protein